MTDETARADPGAPGVAGRRFGDQEIRDILERAADFQERSTRLTDGRSAGLTLAEIRQVAREVGIDPRFVDLAVAADRQPSGGGEGGLLGGRYRWQHRRTVPGALDDRDRERILQAIRSVMGEKGTLEDIYGRMEWSWYDGLGTVLVGISEDEGQVEVELTASRQGEVSLMHGLGIPLGGGLGGGAIAGIIGVSGPAGALPLIGAGMALAWGAARMAWRARSRWWGRKLEATIEHVTAVTAEAAAATASEGEE